MRTKQTKAEQMRYLRLYKRILTMITESKHCQFLTITFNNDTLMTTTKETRKRYVKKWLNRNATSYVLNVDYGDKNNREHYHAIATPNNERFNYKSFKNGFILGEIIGLVKRWKGINKDVKQIAKRLSKHALKESTNNAKIIYSRPNNKTNKAFKEFLAFMDDELNAIYGSDETPTADNITA